MRLVATLITCLGLLAVALTGSARAAKLPVKAKLSHCTTSLHAIDRSFDTTAAMKRIKHTSRMAIRFDIQARKPGAARYKTVKGVAGFGVFFKSDKGVGGYRYSRTTNNLAAPAYYRMRVGFRWYDKHGKKLKTAYRFTNHCHQPDLRPDLVVRRPKVAARVAGGDFYGFRVFNRGLTTATAPFDVTISLADGTKKTRTIAQDIAPGKFVFERFAGPTCSATNPTSVALDPGDAVDESREFNNRFTFTCP